MRAEGHKSLDGRVTILELSRKSLEDDCKEKMTDSLRQFRAADNQRALVTMGAESPGSTCPRV